MRLRLWPSSLKIDLRNSKPILLKGSVSPRGPGFATPDRKKPIKISILVWILLLVLVVALGLGILLGNRMVRAQLEPFVQAQFSYGSGNLDLYLDQELLVPLEHHLAQGQEVVLNFDLYHSRASGLFAQDRLLGALGVRSWYDPFQDLWVLESRITSDPMGLARTDLVLFRSWQELLGSIQPISWPLVSDSMILEEDDSFRLRVLAELPKLNSHLWILRPFLFEQVFTQYLEITLIDQ